MAPTLLGTNVITEFEDKVVTALASKTEFQSYAGVATEADAREHIFVNAIPQPDITQPSGEVYTEADWLDLFPLVRVEMPEDGGWQWQVNAHGDKWTFAKTWIYDLMFQRFPVPLLDTDNQEALRRLENDVGDVMEAISNDTADTHNLGIHGFLIEENASIGNYAEKPQLNFYEWKWRIEGRQI